MLSINDVLIANLVEDVMQWDGKESFLTGNKSPPWQADSSHQQLWGVIFCVGKMQCWWQRIWNMGLDKPHGGW